MPIMFGLFCVHLTSTLRLRPARAAADRRRYSLAPALFRVRFIYMPIMFGLFRVHLTNTYAYALLAQQPTAAATLSRLPYSECALFIYHLCSVILCTFNYNTLSLFCSDCS